MQKFFFLRFIDILLILKVESRENFPFSQLFLAEVFGNFPYFPAIYFRKFHKINERERGQHLAFFLSSYFHHGLLRHPRNY
jgi:hypothetical protein